MGDFDDGRDMGLWGDDGMPYWLDDDIEDDKSIKNEKDKAIRDGKIVVINGLMYQNIDFDSIGSMYHEEAINYSKNLRLGGMDGWRLPTREELHKIANIELYGKYDDNYKKWFNEHKDKRIKNSKGLESFIKEEFKESFGNYAYFCTSEKYDLSSWLHVSFRDGRDFSSDAGKDSLVLCVRSNTIYANSKIDKDNSLNISKYKTISINLTPSKYLTLEEQNSRNSLINNELNSSQINLKIIHNPNNTHDSLALEVYNNDVKIGHIQKYDNLIEINQFCFINNQKVDNLKIKWINDKFRLYKDKDILIDERKREINISNLESKIQIETQDKETKKHIKSTEAKIVSIAFYIMGTMMIFNSNGDSNILVNLLIGIPLILIGYFNG